MNYVSILLNVMLGVDSARCIHEALVGLPCIVYFLLLKPLNHKPWAGYIIVAGPSVFYCSSLKKRAKSKGFGKALKFKEKPEFDRT